MGFICDLLEVKKIVEKKNDFLIISCISLEIIKNTFNQFKILSLGEVLSKELLKIEKNNRKFAVESILKQILSNIDKNELLIMDIDILFNPEYKLDIIKLFIQLSRNKKIIVQWPGKLDSQYLIYSTPEYEDYRRYFIKNYDIICLR